MGTSLIKNDHYNENVVEVISGFFAVLDGHLWEYFIPNIVIIRMPFYKVNLLKHFCSTALALCYNKVRYFKEERNKLWKQKNFLSLDVSTC